MSISRTPTRAVPVYTHDWPRGAYEYIDAESTICIHHIVAYTRVYIYICVCVRVRVEPANKNATRSRSLPACVQLQAYKVRWCTRVASFVYMYSWHAQLGAPRPRTGLCCPRTEGCIGLRDQVMRGMHMGSVIETCDRQNVSIYYYTYMCWSISQD